MKKNLLITLILISVLLLLNSYIWAQNHLNDNRKGDWLNAGFMRFWDDEDFVITKYINILDYDGANNTGSWDNDNVQAINNAIEDRDLNEDGFTMIYFPEGSYNFASSIEINYEDDFGVIKNIVLIGEGSAKTRFYFDFSGQSGDCIEIIGEWNNSSCLLETDDQFGDPDNQDINGHYQIINPFGDNSNPVMNIGIEDLFIHRIDDQPMNGNYQGMHIRYKFAKNCWISGVNSWEPPRHHVYITNSENIEIRGCYFHNAKQYGEGGEGYGIQVGYYTRKCLIEDNFFNSLRHAMLIMDGANSNVFGYNFSRYPTSENYNVFRWPPDMCLHGHNNYVDVWGNFPDGAYRNLFEGNIGCHMRADEVHEENRRYNTFLRNYAKSYGITIMESSNYQNIIGNEVSTIGTILPGWWIDPMGPYEIQGSGHYEKGNTIEGDLPDIASDDLFFYYDNTEYSSINPPEFLSSLDFWPSIGYVDIDHTGFGTNPAKMRFDANGSYAQNTVRDYCFIIPDLGSVEGTVSLVSGNGNITEVIVNAGDTNINPDEDGYYKMNLPAGTYNITASLPGYSFDIVNNIIIEDESLTTADLSLNYNGIVIVNQDGPGHFDNIQDAVDYSLVNDINSIYIAPGVYNEGANIVVDNDVSLEIHGTNKEQCIIDGTNTDSQFGFLIEYNTDNSGIKIYNLTIRNFSTCIRTFSTEFFGSPSVHDNIFENCGEYVIENYGCFPLIKNNTFQNNGIDNNGIYSVINNQNNHIKLIGNTFTNNNSNQLGIVYVMVPNWEEYDYSSIIENNTFIQNESEFQPIFLYYSGNVEISNNQFIENYCEESDYGSVIEMKYCGDNCMIKGNLFNNNSHNDASGIIQIEESSGDCEISNNTFINNGGVEHIIYSTGSTTLVDITNCIFESNVLYTMNVIHDQNANCDYSLFVNNVLFDSGYPVYNGNCNFGDYIYSEVDPKLDDNFMPIWDNDYFSPCIDTGDPNMDWDADDTPPDIGAIPAITHSFFKDDYDNEEFDCIDWISFPVLNTITNDCTEAIALLIGQNLITPGNHPDDILDYVEYEDLQYIIFQNNVWINNLPPDGDFHSEQGYILHLLIEEPYPVKGISGIWQDESIPISLLESKDNWIGRYLTEPAYIQDAFESIWDEWTVILSEHWAICREEWEEMQRCGWTVNPGELYIVEVENDCNLVWNKEGSVPPFTREQTDYFTYVETADYMPILVDTVYSDTTIAEIAVFFEDECLGASKVTDGYPVQILAYTPTVVRSDNGLEFRILYDDGKRNLSKSIPYIMYNSDVHAYIDQPLYYQSKNFEKVQLNTSESTFSPTIALNQNYPNPVRSSFTTISFLPDKEAQHTEVTIYNIKGQLVKRINCDEAIVKGMNSGYYSVQWDCCNDHGREVSNGIYFYRLTSGNKNRFQKMLIMK